MSLYLAPPPQRFQIYWSKAVVFMQYNNFDVVCIVSEFLSIYVENPSPVVTRSITHYYLRSKNCPFLECISYLQIGSKPLFPFDHSLYKCLIYVPLKTELFETWEMPLSTVYFFVCKVEANRFYVLTYVYLSIEKQAVGEESCCRV